MTSLGSGRAQGSNATLICCAVFIVIHLLFAPQITLGGVAPGFLLVALCVLTVGFDQTASVWAGFILGLLFDLTGSGPVGLSSLLGCILGFVVSQRLRRDGGSTWSAPLPTCTLGLFVYNVVYPLVLVLSGTSLGSFGAVLRMVVVLTIVDALMLALALWCIEHARGKRTSGGIRLG